MEINAIEDTIMSCLLPFSLLLTLSLTLALFPLSVSLPLYVPSLHLLLLAFIVPRFRFITNYYSIFGFFKCSTIITQLLTVPFSLPPVTHPLLSLSLSVSLPPSVSLLLSLSFCCFASLSMH